MTISAAISTAKCSVTAAALMLGTLLFPSAALGQGMSYSVYFDNSLATDGSSVYLGVSVIDSSWGCTHGSYGTTATIVSPSTRIENAWSGGLYSNTSMAINGEHGDYTFGGHTSYSCSCTSQPEPFNDGMVAAIFPYTHYYTRSVTATPPDNMHTYVPTTTPNTSNKVCSRSSYKAPGSGSQLTVIGLGMGPVPTNPYACVSGCYNGHVGLFFGITGNTLGAGTCDI